MNATCDCGKVKYLNKVSANVAMLRAGARRQRKHLVAHAVTVYLCPLCNGWHMTKLYRPASKTPRPFRPDRQWAQEAHA